MSIASWAVVGDQGFRVIPSRMAQARVDRVRRYDRPYLQGADIRGAGARYAATGGRAPAVDLDLNEFIAQQVRATPNRDPSLVGTNHDSAVIVGPRNIEAIPVVAVVPNQQTAGGAGPPVRVGGSRASSRATAAPAVAVVAAQQEEGPPPAQRRPRQPRQRSRSRTPCAKSVVCGPVGKGLRQCRGAMRGTTPCKALGSALRQCR